MKFWKNTDLLIEVSHLEVSKSFGEIVLETMAKRLFLDGLKTLVMIKICILLDQDASL